MLGRRRLHVDIKDCRLPVNNYVHITPKIGSLWGGGCFWARLDDEDYYYLCHGYAVDVQNTPPATGTGSN